jgi:hypothetical protein
LNPDALSLTMSPLYNGQKAMNNPFEALAMPGSILLLGFLSALLLPAPAFGLQLANHLMTLFHFSDLGQLYTIVFGLWFLLLGTLEFFLIRFVWRRFFRV